MPELILYRSQPKRLESGYFHRFDGATNQVWLKPFPWSEERDTYPVAIEQVTPACRDLVPLTQEH